MLFPETLHVDSRRRRCEVTYARVSRDPLASEEVEVVLAEEGLQQGHAVRRPLVVLAVQHRRTTGCKLCSDGVPYEAHVGPAILAQRQLHRIDAEVRDGDGILLKDFVARRPRTHVEALPTKAVALAVEPDLLLGVAGTVLICELVPIEEADVPAIVDPTLRQESPRHARADLLGAACGDAFASIRPTAVAASPSVEVDDRFPRRIVERRLRSTHRLQGDVAVAEPIDPRVQSCRPTSGVSSLQNLRRAMGLLQVGATRPQGTCKYRRPDNLLLHLCRPSGT
mmetsp:Transcript_7839/g.16401  ORF Transcript_7839/g.16401 Transcript_7839/m.16401 type:complete len:282 (-) Transcript_7839:84-929(-)